jgi:hypothetical protein
MPVSDCTAVRQLSMPRGMRSVKAAKLINLVCLVALLVAASCRTSSSGYSPPACDNQLPTILAALKVSESTRNFETLEIESQRYFASDSEIVRQTTESDKQSMDAFLSTAYGLATFSNDSDRFRNEFESVRRKWQQSATDRLTRTQFFARTFQGVDQEVALAALKQYEDCRDYIAIKSTVLESGTEATDFTLGLRYTMPGLGPDGERFVISKVIMSSSLSAAPQDDRTLEHASVTKAGIQRVIRLSRNAPNGWMTIEFGSAIPPETVFFEHVSPLPLIFDNYSLYLVSVEKIGGGSIELANTFLRSVMIQPLREDSSVLVPSSCELPSTSTSRIAGWEKRRVCTMRVGTVTGNLGSLRANIQVELATNQDDIDPDHKGQSDIQQRRAFPSTLKGVDILKSQSLSVEFNNHGTLRLTFELKKD